MNPSNPSLLTIRLTGEGVRPHLIPVRDLAGLLEAAEQMVSAIVAREHPDLADNFFLGLSAVRDESIGFGFDSNHPQVAVAAY